MPVANYRMWSKGAVRRSESNSLVEFYDVGVHALAKESLINPYEIANEVIAMRLGHAINLPIPLGSPIRREDRNCFASLIFRSGHRLPPADTPAAVAHDCRLCCGILIFDSWVLNDDRNETNLSFDEDTKELMAFDHGQALFGSEGADRFSRLFESIGVGRDNHALALDIHTLQPFDEWHDRTASVPDFLIKEIVFDSIGNGISSNEADACVSFLLKRRRKIRQLFFDHQADTEIFPSIITPLSPSITSNGDDHIEYHI